MGAWGHTIDQNDEYCDVVYSLKDIEKPSRGRVMREVDKFIATHDWAPEKAKVGMYMMHYAMVEGWPITEELRALAGDGVIKSINNVEEQGWNEPEKRIEKLNEFMKQMLVYDVKGEKIEISVGKGVLETVFEGLNEHKTQ